MNRVHLCLLFAAVVSGVSGCARFIDIPQAQSAIEQQLLVRALERSVDGLETEEIAGRTVSLRLSTTAKDQEDFVKEFIAARLQERNVGIVENAARADRQIHVFAQVLGTDRGEALVGIPALPTPFVGLATPEIALYKQDANRGRSETQMFVFDAESGRFLGKSPVSVGKSRYDNYTILLFIKFTIEDIGVPGDDAPLTAP